MKKIKERGGFIKELKLYQISPELYEKLFNKWSNHEYVDHLLYFFKSDDKYISIDNEAGEFFVEEFDSMEKAICWLIRTDYSSIEINNMSKEDILNLYENNNYKIIYNKEIEYGV